MKRKRKILAALLVVVLMISGTLAWRDISQHKSNKLQTSLLNHNVVLVEDFEEVNDWSASSDPIKKKVSVRNGNDIDDLEKYQYEDAFVRLQLREFMAIMKTTPTFSENRYLIDVDGNFVKGESADEVLLKAQAIDPNIVYSDLERKISYTDPQNIAADGGFWYVKTNDLSINGIYGKFLIIDIEEDPQGYISQLTGNPIDIDNLDKSMSIHHNDIDDKDVMEDLDEYATHTWTETFMDLGFEMSLFKKLVNLNFGNEVITYDQWVKEGAKATKKWILDTNSPEGWVYWGKRLRHGNVGSVIKGTQTSTFLESVKLTENPDGNMIYRIHINLDSVSKNDLDAWENVPIEIMDALKNDTINWDYLEEAVINAEDKLNRATRLDRYVLGSREDLMSIVKQAKKMLDLKEEDDQLIIDDITDKVLNATKRFRLNLNYEGELKVNTRIKDFAGKNWTVAHIDSNQNALLIADPFTQDELVKLGVKDIERKDNKLFFSSNKINYENGYDGSILKKVNDSFYNAKIRGHNEESFVQPVFLRPEPARDESANAQDIYDRIDGASFVSEYGTPQSFTLSISDWNLYIETSTRNQILNDKTLWTTTPGVKDKSGLVTSIISISTNN